MRIGINKRCPRCNAKSPVGLVVCPGCQLNFQKFESATNAEAKQAIKQSENERVLMRKSRPSDVKFWPLFLLTLFLGYMGAHYYYVGRNKMGLFFTVFFIVGLTNAIISSIIEVVPTGDLWQVFSLMVLVWGAVIFIWIVDIAKVALNKFKIPVSRS